MITLNQKATNNATTLLAAYFLKIKLTDVVIQRRVVYIFLPALVAVMRDIPQDGRSKVFKHLLGVVGLCVDVYQQSGKFFDKKIKDRKLIDNLCVNVFGTTTRLIVELLKTKTSHSRRVVDRILHSVFIDDLACDMGVKITEYRKSSPTEAMKLKLAIELLLVDYNEINNTNLTFDDVINRGVTDENGRNN